MVKWLKYWGLSWLQTLKIHFKFELKVVLSFWIQILASNLIVHFL